MSVRYLQSIGMSCQTRHQIERFGESLAGKAAGVELRGGLFDWLGAPPRRTARYLDLGLPDNAPGTVVDCRDHAFYSTPGFHAYHAFRLKDSDGARRLAIEATFDREAEKFAYLRQKFVETNVAETAFVLGNAQNNLDGEVYRQGEAGEFRFDSAAIDVLHESLERFFKARCRLFVVARSDRFDGDASRDPRVWLIPPEPSEWKGDDRAWDAALLGLLGLADTTARSVAA